MSNLINIYDFELFESKYQMCGNIVEGKKLSNKSTILKTAVRNMKAKNKFHIEKDEDVVDPFKLLLMCHEISVAKRNKEL